MKKAIFIYNPQSGLGRIERKKEAIIDCFTHHGYTIEAVRIDFTQNPFEGREEIDLVVKWVEAVAAHCGVSLNPVAGVPA